MIELSVVGEQLLAWLVNLFEEITPVVLIGLALRYAMMILAYLGNLLVEAFPGPRTASAAD